MNYLNIIWIAIIIMIYAFHIQQKKKTDIILNDRQKIFKDENLTLCQE